MKKLSLTLKIAGIIIIFLLLTSVIIIISLEGFNKINRANLNIIGIQTVVDSFKEIHARIHLLRNHEKDFFLNLDPQYAMKINDERKSIDSYISTIIDKSDNQNVIENVQSISTALNIYYESFEDVTDLYRKQGFTEEEGLRGDFTYSALELEKVFRESKDEALLVELLIMRKYEKNYLLYRKDRTASKLRDSVMSIRKQIQNTQFKLETRNELNDLLDDYLANFNALTVTESKINISKQILDEKNRDIQPLINLMEKTLEEQVNKINDTKELIRKEVTNRLLITSLGILVLLSFLGYLLMRSITKPLSKLINATTKITEGNLSDRIQIESHDEIGELTSSFNLMTEKLKESTISKTYLDDILNSMINTLIVINPDSTIRTVNQSVLDLLGYEQSELVGKSINRIIDREQILFGDSEISKSINKEPVSGVEINYLRKDGRKIPVLFSSSPMRYEDGEINGIVCAAQEIIELKRLQDERMKLSTVVEQAAESIVITDTEGRIQYVNPSFERVTGYTNKEVKGLNYNFIDSDQYTDSFYKKRWQALQKGDVWKGTIENKRKDGSVIEQMLVMSPIINDWEQIINYVGIYLDITTEKKLEHELRQSQKMEAIGILVGGVAHEFNNMLQPIIGYTEILRDSKSKDHPDIDNLNIILQSANRASDLVKKLLSYSRQSMEQYKTVDLETVLEELLALIKNTLSSGIVVKKEIEPNLLPVWGMPNEILQLLLNICINASHAMPDGGDLIIGLKNVGFKRFVQSRGQQIEGEYICISIRDTGTGIEPDILDRIYDPFFTTKEFGLGSGLGLSVVLGIVEQHSGHIEVESRIGKGTEFRIYLPVTHKREKLQDTKKVSITRGAEHILLIDDEQVILISLKKILEKMGYKITEVMDSTEALKIFQNNPRKFDLIITDYGMSGINGKELAQKTKEIDADTPIILITGYRDLFSREDLSKLGIDDMLVKPFRTEELNSAVRSVLDKKNKH